MKNIFHYKTNNTYFMTDLTTFISIFNFLQEFWSIRRLFEVHYFVDGGNAFKNVCSLALGSDSRPMFT
jgi:hypothetical protein